MMYRTNSAALVALLLVSVCRNPLVVEAFSLGGLSSSRPGNAAATASWSSSFTPSSQKVTSPA
eukprot:scaffold29312_cov92-Amphora_coffeaeformis.AAC.1